MRRRRRAHAKGTLVPNGLLMMAVRFDEELFDNIQRQAIAANIPFAEQVRRFARDGLKRRRAA